MSNELYQFTENTQSAIAGDIDYEEREAILREVYRDVAPNIPTDDEIESMYREQHARVYGSYRNLP